MSKENPSRRKQLPKEVLILDGIVLKYAIHLRFETDEELQEVIQVLEPLGYKFRRPRR